MVEPDDLVNPIQSSGRRAVVHLVDNLLSQKENMHALAEAMQKAFERAPLLFVEAHVKDMITKSMLEDGGGEGPESMAAKIRQLLKDTDDLHIPYEGENESANEGKGEVEGKGSGSERAK